MCSLLNLLVNEHFIQSFAGDVGPINCYNQPKHDHSVVQSNLTHVEVFPPQN